MGCAYDEYCKETEAKVEELCQKLTSPDPENSRQLLLGIMQELQGRMLTSFKEYGKTLDQLEGATASCALAKDFNKHTLRNGERLDLLGKVEEAVGKSDAVRTFAKQNNCG